MDGQYHDEWAIRIAQGDWMGQEVFFRAPLYPYFLAIVYKIFGHSYYSSRLIQFLIGSVSCIFVYLLGKKTFNRRVGFIASLIASFYGVFIYFEGELLLTSLVTFLLLAFFLTLLHTYKNPARGKWFISGLLLGLAAITRPNTLVLIPFVLVWLYVALRSRSRVFGKATILGWGLILFAGTLSIIVPVVVRNYAVGRDFVPIASQGGINFFIGNNRHSDGFTAIAPGTRPGWFEGYQDAIRIATETVGRELKPSEVSDFWFSKGIEFMLGRPSEYVKLLFKKFFFFWHGFELSNNKEIYFFTRYSPFLSAILWTSWLCIPFGLISPLFVLGFVLSLRYEKSRRDNLTLISGAIFVYMLSVVTFFVCARYRVPVLPLVLIFASYALYWASERIKEAGYRAVLVFTLFAVFLGFLLNFGFFDLKRLNPALMHYTLGTVYQKKGQLRQAEAEYRQALQANSHLSKAYVNLGIMYSDEGDFRKAEENLRKSISLDFSNEKAHFNLGTLYARTGQYERAVYEYETALEIIPDYEDAAYLAGVAYERLGMIQKAIEKWEYCLQINPHNARASAQLNQIRE
jgi:4-amino-4-deoxy-L-arabinose transferase-like glycosyltransferase